MITRNHVSTGHVPDTSIPVRGTLHCPFHDARDGSHSADREYSPRWGSDVNIKLSCYINGQSIVSLLSFTPTELPAPTFQGKKILRISVGSFLQYENKLTLLEHE